MEINKIMKSFEGFYKTEKDYIKIDKEEITLNFKTKINDFIVLKDENTATYQKNCEKWLVQIFATKEFDKITATVIFKKDNEIILEIVKEIN